MVDKSKCGKAVRENVRETKNFLVFNIKFSLQEDIFDENIVIIKWIHLLKNHQKYFRNFQILEIKEFSIILLCELQIITRVVAVMKEMEIHGDRYFIKTSKSKQYVYDLVRRVYNGNDIMRVCLFHYEKLRNCIMIMAVEIRYDLIWKVRIENNQWFYSYDPVPALIFFLASVPKFFLTV